MTSDGSGGSGEDRTHRTRSEVREATFEPVVAAVREARRFAAAAAPEGAGEESLERLALVTSELATNAVLHARTPFTVQVTASGATVRIEVRDRSPEIPPPQQAAPGDVSGRGLSIVAALATRWGVDTRAGLRGKRVWAELDMRGASG